MQHLADLGLQRFPTLAAAPATRKHGVDVAPQRGPPELPPPAGIPGVGAPASRHPRPPEALAPTLWGPLGATRPPDDKDGDASGDGHPQPGPLLPVAPSRFIQVRRGLGWPLGPGLGPRHGQRLDERLRQVGNAPTPDRDAAPIFPERLGEALRQVVCPRAQRRNRLPPRTESPGWDISRQRRPRRLTTHQADQTGPLIRSRHRPHQGDFRHLMALGLGVLPASWVLTAGALPWLPGEHHIDRCDRHQHPAMPGGAMWPARPTPRGLSTRPVASGLGGIACGWARGGPRVLRQLFLYVLDGRLQLPDGALQPLEGGL